MHNFVRLMSAGHMLRVDVILKGSQDCYLRNAVFVSLHPSTSSSPGDKDEIVVCDKLHDNFDHLPVWHRCRRFQVRLRSHTLS